MQINTLKRILAFSMLIVLSGFIFAFGDMIDG